MSDALDQELLRTLHRILRQQSDLDGRLTRGPKQIAAARNSIKHFENELVTAKESLKQNRMATDGKNLQLDERRAKIEDYRAKRNACDSNREYQLLTDQIAADEQANNVLSDEIFELMERGESIESEIETAVSNVDKATQESGKIIARIEAEMDTAKSESERVRAEFDQTIGKLPGELKQYCKRQIPVIGENALAMVDDECCGNCFNMISPQNMSDLLMSRLVYCSSCSSLLYLPEGHSIAKK